MLKISRFRSISPKAKWGHCGVASELPKTANHMSQQCPRFALLTATLPIFQLQFAPSISSRKKPDGTARVSKRKKPPNTRIPSSQTLAFPVTTSRKK
jgi:hypothetical protein